MAVGTDRAVLSQRFRVVPYFVLALEIEQVWCSGAVEALEAVEDATGLRVCDRSTSSCKTYIPEVTFADQAIFMRRRWCASSDLHETGRGFGGDSHV